MRETPGQAVDRVTASWAPGTTTVSKPTGALPMTSPWATTELARVVYDELFDAYARPANTRSSAMRLSPIARSRNLFCTTVSRFPLVPLRGDERLADEVAPWLFRTSGATSPQHRMVWTVDDLIFYGWSCWYRTNGQDGFPLVADRVPQEEWTINGDNRVEINGMAVPDNQVILIPGFHEGILTYGVDVLRDATQLARNVRSRITNPIPGLELHQTGGDPLTREQITQLVNDWAKARAGVNGGVAYTNESIETKELGNAGDQLMIESRNAAALELARIVGVSGSRIDATVAKASLNYETTTGRNQEFVDFDLALYMAPIAARLSLDDVTPRGRRVAFDTDEFTSLDPAPTGPTIQD